MNQLRLTKFLLTLELAGNGIIMNIISRIFNPLLRRELLQNHLILNLAMMKKKKVLTWRNASLKQVKSYIEINLNPAKLNVIDPNKDPNFTQPLGVQEILNEL